MHSCFMMMRVYYFSLKIPECEQKNVANHVGKDMNARILHLQDVIYFVNLKKPKI